MLFGECFRQNASLLDCGEAFFDGLRAPLKRGALFDLTDHSSTATSITQYPTLHQSPFS